MRSLILTALLCSASWAGISNIITDPALSVRCKILIQERDQKLAARQRARALLRRSQSMEENAPTIKQSIRKRLHAHSKKLEQMLATMDQRAQVMGEEIVRQGCPGLAL